MKINNQIKIEATIQFQDLVVGDVYEDDEGIICIKTSGDDYGDSPYGKCIAFVDDEWREEDEHRETYVKPLETSLVLHGYKTKARK